MYVYVWRRSLEYGYLVLFLPLAFFLPHLFSLRTSHHVCLSIVCCLGRSLCRHVLMMWALTSNAQTLSPKQYPIKYISRHRLPGTIQLTRQDLGQDQTHLLLWKFCTQNKSSSLVAALAGPYLRMRQARNFANPALPIPNPPRRRCMTPAMVFLDHQKNRWGCVFGRSCLERKGEE